MDPLIVSASLIAVLQLSGTVISYLSDVKDGPKELQRIQLELSSTHNVLFMLQDQADHSEEDDPFSSTLRSLNGPSGPFQQFHDALERLASRLAPLEGWRKLKKAFKWSFEKEEIHDILKTIERQKTYFSLARQNDHIALSKAIGEDVDAIRKGNDKISVEVDKTSTGVEMISAGVTNIQTGEKHKAYRQWLSAPDPSSNYNKALRNRYGDTGDWFLETNDYLRWLSKPGFPLWLYGIPGCGKTILSSTIIQETIVHSQSQIQSVVLYFYFDFNDIEKQQHEKMVRSLIIQLSSQCVNTSRILESLYSSCTNGARQPDYDSLLSTLHQMMGCLKETYLILDALDECGERQGLLKTVEELASWKDANVHLLMTSRKEKDIEDSIEPLLNGQGKICIQSVLVNEDIRTYVRGRLQTDRELKRWRKDIEAQREIENTLMEKADGMFRWAACQLDSLRKCLNRPALRKGLASLPKTLDDTYIRILCNIDEDYQQCAIKILQWLTYSARPLELEEVAEVIAIDVEGEPRFDLDRRFPEPQDILTICSSLISLEVDKSKKWNDRNIEEGHKVIIRLAHFSVKEYLVSERILQGDAKHYSIQEIDTHVAIQNDCLAYLLGFDGFDSLTSQSLAGFPLARYAARYWTQHARKAERDGNITPHFSVELFLTQGNGMINWICLCDPDEPWEGLNTGRILRGFPLYYASTAGLHRSVQILLDKGANVNTQGGKYGNALQAASVGGHDRVVQILLDKGADVNAQGGQHGNALQVASQRGHDRIVQILLDNGADVNTQTQGREYRNALHAASRAGHDRIVQILLDKRADVNAQAQGGFVRNALQAASARGHDRVIQILLDKGAKF